MDSVSGELTVEVCDRGPVAPDVVARWHELALAARNPFALPAWHEAWLAAHPADAPMVLVCREADGAVVGVVALVARGSRRVLVSAGDQTGDWWGPACAPADEGRVAAAVVATLGSGAGRWDEWQLDRCRAGGAWLDGIVGASRRHGLRAVPHRGEDVLISIDLVADGPELVQGKRRREIDRLHRRLRKDHEVVVRTSTEPDEVAADFDRLLELRTEQWGQGFDPATHAFQRAFAVAAAEAGVARIHVLEVDGSKAALLYGWRIEERAFAYMQAFDHAYDRHGVGMWLLAHTVRQSAGEGCEVFDMLRGDEGHKRHFTTRLDEVVCHRVARRHSLGRLRAEAHVAGRAAYQRLTPEQRERLRRALRI